MSFGRIKPYLTDDLERIYDRYGEGDFTVPELEAIGIQKEMCLKIIKRYYVNCVNKKTKSKSEPRVYRLAALAMSAVLNRKRKQER